MARTFERDRLTWLTYLFLGFYTFFLNALGPVTPFLKAELGLSYTVSSLHFTAFAIGMVLVGLGGHLVIERMGRRRALWTAVSGISLGALLLVVGKMPAITIGAALVMGTIGSLILVIVPSVLSDRHGERRPVALAEANVVASSTSAAAPLLVGWTVALFGDWRLALGSVALLPVVLYPNFRKVTFPVGAQTRAEAEAAPRSLPRLYWIYWTALFLSVAVEFCMISWSVDYVENVLGLSKASAAQALSLFLIAMIVGRLAASWVVQRVPTRRWIVASIGVAAIGFLLFWRAEVPVVGLMGLFVTGLGVAGLYPLILALALAAAPNNTVQASARAALASGTAILTLPLLLGSLADAVGIQSAYSIVVLLLLGMFFMIQIAGRPQPALQGS